MKRTIKRWFVALLMATSFSVFAEAPERVLWDKTPISVHIQMGEERIIHFPDDIRYWLPDSIQRKVTVLAANGVLYIRAVERFPVTRIRVQGLNDQQVYLLDIYASEQAMTTPEMVVMTPETTTNRNSEVVGVQPTEDWRVRLTRHAARQLYAPERLSGADSAIKRVPLDMVSAIPLVRGGVLESVPIASWRAQGLTVTAIKLNNLTENTYGLGFGSSKQSDDLDLAEFIRGNWLTATLQHNSIGAKGQEDDSTVLYLVSKGSFEDSLGWMIPGVPGTEEADNG